MGAEDGVSWYMLLVALGPSVCTYWCGLKIGQRSRPRPDQIVEDDWWLQTDGHWRALGAMLRYERDPEVRRQVNDAHRAGPS